MLEVLESCLDFGEAFVHEVGGVAAGSMPAVADGDDLTDLPDGEARGLGVADEGDAVHGVVWIVAVAAVGAGGLVEESLGFPVAQRLGRNGGGVGEPHR